MAVGTLKANYHESSEQGFNKYQKTASSVWTIFTTSIQICQKHRARVTHRIWVTDFSCRTFWRRRQLRRRRVGRLRPVQLLRDRFRDLLQRLLPVVPGRVVGRVRFGPIPIRNVIGGSENLRRSQELDSEVIFRFIQLQNYFAITFLFLTTDAFYISSKKLYKQVATF